MASIKYSDIEKELKKLSSDTSSLEIGYTLLKAFGTSDTYIKRYKAGKGNFASFDGILTKKQLAYKPVDTLQLTDELEVLKQDPKVAKQNPRIIAVSDGETLLAYDTKESESYENKIEKLWLDFQFFYPLAGIDKFSVAQESEADVKAAVKMAKLHSEIRRQNEFSSQSDIHDLNIFMTRLLFCFFAEDTGIFKKDIFSNYIQQCTQDDGSDLSEALDTIFNVMDSNSRRDLPNVISQFPYVNGGLFSSRITIPELNYKVRRIILECGELNWGEINPDIFGSMFQGVVTPELRGDFGMHYTSVPNILKLIQPLFLNDLEEAFAKAWGNEKQLNALLVRISKMKFFDPACGSGNFLIITYKELRKLEIRIWKRIAELTGSHVLPYTNISIMQFYGIEIDSFAHEVAMLSLWLAEHQMNALFSKTFTNVHIDALPLKNIDHIRQGNACRVDWNEVCPHTPDEEVFVMGNPPYLGSRKQDESHKDDLKYVYGNEYKSVDYIAAWFYLGAKYIHKTNAKFAFVSTNSICQGEQVSLIWKSILNLDTEIFFAYNSFKWANNASFNAGVTVIIVGLRNVSVGKKVLFENNTYSTVENISPYLTNSKTIFVDSANNPISKFPPMNFGNMPADNGCLLFTDEEKREFIQKEPETAKFFKPILSAEEFLNGKKRWCLWLYGINATEYNKFTSIVSIIDRLREVRLKSSRPQLAEIPHLFAQITQPQGFDFVLIPRHSSENREYIPMGYCDKTHIASDSCMLVAINECWLFGILTSKMHMAWVKAVGGKLETRYRYSASLVYNTFPFPEISLNKRKIIDALAEEVLLTREHHSGKTLAEMYDPDKMPADLRAAHHALDMAVDGCYQSAPFNNDEERLACLFKLYEKMTK